MELGIELFCQIIEGTIVQRGSVDFVSSINIYPIMMSSCDTFCAINSAKYSTSDCGFGNSGNEDSVFGLKGTQNSHLNIGKMVNSGVKTIVFDEDIALEFVPGINYIRVEDSVASLAKYARYKAKTLGTRIVGITGSTGKTTLTRLIVNLLSHHFNVQTTEFIRITYVGLIWFIIHELRPDTDWLVIEMQIDGTGQIDRLCEVVELDVAFLVNIGPAHLERFGSIDNILWEKLGVYRGLKRDGYLFVNDECECLNKWRRKVVDPRIIPVNRDAETEAVTVDGVHYDTFALLQAFNKLVCNTGVEDLLQIYKKNNIVGRYQSFEGINGATVIVDTYNASFISTRYGLEMLSKHCKKKKILVLGSLLELGSKTETVHRDIGRYICALGNIDYAVFIGEATLYVMDEAKDSLRRCKHVYSYHKAMETLQDFQLTEDSVVYIKGSGAMRLELLALQLIGRLCK